MTIREEMWRQDVIDAKYDKSAGNACRKAGLTVEALEAGALERWKTALEVFASSGDAFISRKLKRIAQTALAGGKEEGR